MHAITADLTNGFLVTVSNGRHRWHADEPVDLGGSDEGPTPYEMLLGSVASCTAITLSMYAQRKGFTIESISVRYEYERVHGVDSRACADDEERAIDTVRSEIFIDGDFTDDQRARLADIAVRCPVHRTLERGVVFDDHIVVG